MLTKAQREDPIGFLDRDYEDNSSEFETNRESDFGRVVINLGWYKFSVARHFNPNELVTVSTEIVDKRDSKTRPSQGI